MGKIKFILGYGLWVKRGCDFFKHIFVSAYSHSFIYTIVYFFCVLPNDLERYYSQLSNYSWNFIENHGISLFNTAWINEVYNPFVNDIAPYYPFNDESVADLSMDSFKTFFGRNGTLNSFYKKYLNNVLVKRKNNYSINSQFASKLNFSKGIFRFYHQCRQSL